MGPTECESRHYVIGRNGPAFRMLSSTPFSPQRPQRPPPHLSISMPPSILSQRGSGPPPDVIHIHLHGNGSGCGVDHESVLRHHCPAREPSQFVTCPGQVSSISTRFGQSRAHEQRQFLATVLCARQVHFCQFQQSYATPPPSIKTRHEDPYEVQTPCAPGSILAVGSRFI